MGKKLIDRHAVLNLMGGKTQRQLAAESQIAEETLSRALNGSPVSRVTYARIAEALGVQVGDILKPTKKE